MSSGPATFRQIDVKRAVKGAAAGGMRVMRVEIDRLTGRIVLFACNDVADEQMIQAPLDKWLASHAR